MSLSKLPDHLKADICSFLNFNDINKLTQTNSKTQSFLKSYKLDKPKIHSLSFYSEIEHPGEGYIECSMKIEEYGGEFIDLPTIEFREDEDIHTAKIASLINKFHLIEELYICNLDLHEVAGWENFTKTKVGCGFIESVRFLFFSKDTILDFFKQFKHIDFKRSLMDESGIDESVIDDEAALANGITRLYWDFGILKQDQYPAVQECVQDDYVEWNIGMNPPLYLQSRDWELECYYMLHPEYHIAIGVEVPGGRHTETTTPQAAAFTPKNAKTTPSKVLTPGSPQVRQRSSNNDNNQYENMNDFDQQVAQEEAKQKAVTDLKDQQNKFTVPKDANKKANPYDLNYDTLRLGPTDDQVFAKKGQQPPVQKK